MDSEKVGRLIHILLVEDSPGDVRLTQEAFKAGKLANKLHVVGDGVEAMAFLRRAGAYADAPRPDVILLDLNLPKKDGREVLAEIKSDENLRRIPTIVLTISNADRDILETYNLNGNCYIRKPVDLARFIEVVTTIEEFWFCVVTLPPNGAR